MKHLLFLSLLLISFGINATKQLSFINKTGLDNLRIDWAISGKYLDKSNLTSSSDLQTVSYPDNATIFSITGSVRSRECNGSAFSALRFWVNITEGKTYTIQKGRCQSEQEGPATHNYLELTIT